MKRKLALLVGALSLCAAGLVTAVQPRPDDPPAPPARGDDKAEPPPKAALSKIVSVTVYPDSALVTREVAAPEGAGTQELVVTPLPEHTINSSLYSEGGDGIRVLTTRFRMRPIRENTREEVRKLEDKAKSLRQNTEKIQADMEACRQNTALLGKLENFTAASTQHATEKGKMDSDATIALAKYLMDGRGEKARELVSLQQQLQNNQEEMQFVARKLQELSAGTSRTERDAVIIVDKANAAAGKVRLNYLVDSASWRPQYKLRAGKDPKDNVSLEYLAAIVQQTGEDWQNVNIKLSTAQPMLNASPPELKMLAVAVVPRGALAGQPGQKVQFAGNLGMGGGGFQGGFGANAPQGQAPNAGPGMGQQGGQQLGGQLGAIPNPEGLAKGEELANTARLLRLAAQQEQNRRNEDNSNEIFNYAGALDQAKDLVLNPEGKVARAAVARSHNEGPSVTYALKAHLTMPSRNDEQVIEVARIDMAPDYFYKAVPVLTPHVYRQANLTNKSEYVLLPGEATMYNGTDFVGRMNLPLVAIGETFTAGFGAEPQLQINRQMADKTRSMQGGNQVLKYEYRILVSSYKPEKVRLQVWDRLPTAENETMGVSLVKTSPEVSKDPLYLREERPHNLLRWDLDVDPAMNGEKALTIQYEFKLELDKTMTIGSFQTGSQQGQQGLPAPAMRK
jgi:hypothetical protein